MTMHFEVLGGAREGPTVLMSSGLGGSGEYWRPQTRALVEQGYRVIVYDQLGTGRSRPASLPEDYSIAHMAAEVVELLDVTHTDTCHFVGHALGGLVGLSLAAQNPSRVRSLTLVNAWARVAAHTVRCFEARLALLGAYGPRAYVQAQPIFLYPAAWCEENAAMVEKEVEHGIEHFPGEQAMRTRIAALRAFDARNELTSLRLPVLISCAMDDVLVPWTESQRLQKGLPHTQLASVERGGHAHNVTRADTFNRTLLSFLSAGVR
jgi:aminoacrylate hydrolase